MARKVTVTLTDDIDDTLEADETVEFGIDGVNYEIDLAAENAQKLRECIANYVESARKTAGRKRGARPASNTKKRGAPMDRSQSAAIREWARNSGMQVNDRGRISQDVVDAYNEAGGRVLEKA